MTSIERGRRGMGGDIIQGLARDDGDVGLGLRDVAHRKGRVLTRMPQPEEV
jgi:hypothetical protein